MGPSRRKGSARAAAAAAAARQQWKIGDLVLAKMKGFPAWPAMISEPEKWGFSSDRKKLLVYFYGTKQIAFCNYADIEAFTEEKKKSLLLKRQGKGADFVRAVEEIIDVFETLKEKNLAVDDSVDENNDGTVSNKDNLKDSTVSCVGKTEEAILNSSDNHQSQCASATESCNMVNEDVNPGTLPGSGNHNISILENGLGEKVSILDQLRQIPLSSISTTRKRARDTIFLSSCRKSCVSSHRRSRSSSGYKLDKPENSFVQAEFEPDAGLQSADVFQQYHSTKEHAFIGSIVSASTETSSISTGVPTNVIHVENLAFKSESINLGDGNVFSYNDNIESSNNSACLNVHPKGDGSINATVDITLKAVAVKRQRKPRKPGAICSEVDKEMESQIENGSLSDSSNSRDGITEKFSKADGDKHLPLVKRARVRMGKPPEEKMDDCLFLRSKVDGNVISATPVPNPSNESLERDSPIFKEAVGSKSNDCTHNNAGRDSLSSKTNKYQLPLFVEAALPPSKRLHRALEAMSANAADDVTDRSQAQRAMETKFDDIMGCLKANFDHVDHSESVKCSTKPLPLQSSNDSTFHGSACGFSSSITAQNQVVYGLTSSKLESDDTCLTKNVMDPIEKNCKKNLVGNGSFDDSITSKMTLDFEEKQCGECVYNHLASPAVEENGWKQLGEESTFPRVDGGSFLVATGTCNARHACLPSIGVAVPQSSDAACSASEMDGDVIVPLAGNVDSFASRQNGVISVSSTPIIGSLGSNMPRLVTASSTATACITSDISRATVSSRREFEESLESRDMQNSSTEVKEHLILKARSVASTLAPIKDLIAAAQAKRFLSRSTSFCDNVIDGKVAPDAVVSPSLISKEDSSGHISPSNPMLNHRPSSDDGTCYLQNGNRTPLGFSSVTGSKYMNHAEANAARKSFESLLCTLSRTKDSIGRATRLAIDCAKCGIAGEVIDMLLHNLEKEPRLHRRIDLFFLVDSITQFSRCQRGGPGDVYPSLVQAVLPRLLSAAAPPGNSASENRRQCLKVLRLWLERRTLPEFIVRHHIRELEYGGEASLINSHSRRPPRTERALNDPVREMEGMLVDEYGSNASFQLPQLFNTRVMEDDAGSASEEKGFESVTPDRSAEVDNEKAITPKSSEKHRLVLEDVDGELEMEDVAPPCGHYVLSTCFVGGVNGVKISNHISKNNSFPFAPPLPEDQPPSPPPLPSSPDPISQPFPISSMDQHHHPSCDKADFYPSRAIQPAENQLPQTLSQLPNMLRVSSSLTESGPPYYGQGYVGHPQQMPALVSSGASSGLYDNLSGSQLAMPPANISQPIVNAPLASKVYALQPPVPVVSNQFSYLQAQPPKRQEAWGNHSSCTDRFDHAFYNQRDKFYRDGVPTGPIPPDPNRVELYPSNHSGHRVLEPDKMEAPPVPPFHGPQLEASSASCQVWSNRPRQFAYPGTAPRPSLENPDFRLTGAPTYWRAR